jgi:biopolymer transport protein ExbD
MAKEALRAEVNVTPLVDVCLVLLIIFMVVTPMLDHPVDLPKTASPERILAETKPAKLTVDYPNGLLWLDGKWLPEPELRAKLAAMKARRDAPPLVIAADARLPFSALRPALRAANAAGYKDVGLSAKREE